MIVSFDDEYLSCGIGRHCGQTAGPQRQIGLKSIGDAPHRSNLHIIIEHELITLVDCF